jgi:hypothetical protein
MIGSGMSTMRRFRLSDWIAVVLLVASLAMIVYALVSLFRPGRSATSDTPDLPIFIAVCSVFVMLPSVGAILAIRRPANPIGWLFLVTGIGFIIGIFSTEYVGRAVTGGASLPFVVLVDWVSAWSGSLSITLAAVWIPLLFPDGHLPGPRWRLVAWAAAILLVVGTLAAAILPDGAHGYAGSLPNPIAVPGPIGEVAAAVVSIYFPALVVLCLLSLASLASRFRRSLGVERQQLKWFLFAVGFLVAAVAATAVTQLEVAWVAVMLGLASLPVAAGIAILRYRLYDIDRLVSRTIAYAAVTGGLVAVYLVANLALSAAFSALSSGNSVAVAASTLIVAALFTPVRRRVQVVVDRRFDRARVDAERTTAAFSERLRDEVDIATVTADLDGIVRSALRPECVGLWLRARDG